MSPFMDYIKKIVSVQENPDGAPVKYEAKEVSLVVPRDPNEQDCELVVSNEDIIEEVETVEEVAEQKEEVKEDKSKKKIYKPFVKNNNNNKKKKNKKNDNKK